MSMEHESAVSLNDAFGGDGSTVTQDTGLGNQDAASNDAPVDDAPVDDGAIIDPEPQGDVDVVQAQDEVVPATQPVPVPPPAPTHLPIDPRYLEMQAEAQKPVTEFFRFLNENAQKQAAAKVQQEQQQQANFRLQQLEAMRPKRPDPATATPEELIDYAGKNAEYAANRARMQVMEEMRQTLGAELEQKLAPLKALQEKAMQDEAARNEHFVSESVRQIASDPRYPFMKNPVVEQAFLRHWWATNEANGGDPVSPQVALNDFIAVQRAFSVPAPVKARTDQQNLDANRRAIQQKNGAPAIPKATSSQSGARNSNTARPGEVKAPDWLSGR